MPEQTSHSSAADLLRTKLTPPRLGASLVPREALLSRLDAGLDSPLTLVAAPAGFGKTTLVSQWLRSRAQSPVASARSRGTSGAAQDGASTTDHASTQPLHTVRSNMAWLALDESDNDPVRFWRYVLAACRTLAADVGESALEVLETAPQPPFEAVLTMLINDLARLAHPGILVLEDYHVITTRQIHDQVALLVDRLPAPLHMIILTREDPPLPLARWRARAAVNELRAADLRFSQAEIQAFLQQTIPVSLTPDLVARLATRTEGWAAGLRLLALAVQGQTDHQAITHALETFTGSHRRIVEYITTDVLAAQPEPIQLFLLQTSMLSRLTASLCDAVLGLGDQGSGGRNAGLVPAAQPLPPDSSSQRILDQLVRANLFLEPLDDEGQWFRYHALFAGALLHEARRRLGEARIRALYANASRWHEQHGFFADAVEAALAAHEPARAAACIERFIEPLHMRNEYHTLRRWLEQVPEEVLRMHPQLCFTYAIAILFTSDRRAPATAALLRTPLALAEEGWRAAGDQRNLGALLTFRAIALWWQDDFPQTFAAAHQALEVLPEDALQWRGTSLLFVVVEELLAGQLHAAQQTVTEARALCQAAGHIFGTLSATFLFGEVCVQRGALRQAAEYYRQVLAAATQVQFDRMQMQFERGRALAGLAALAYEWNDLDTAADEASEALEIGQQLAEEDVLVPAAIILARIEHARGQTAQAQQRLHTLVAQMTRPLLLRQVLAWQARIALAAGELPAAQRWRATHAQRNTEAPRQQQEQAALIVARMHLACGETAAALRLLKDWQADAHAQGRTHSALEMMVLTALAHAANHDLESAGQILVEALGQAQPEGYLRLFLDEGEPMWRLIGQVLAHGRARPSHMPPPAYAGQVLAAFSEAQNGGWSAQEAASARRSPLDRSSGLVEPLSPQEQRVLQLLVAGLSNPEIAQELIVSVNTVKTQVKSIYRKLDVTGRREAREAAHRLKLV